MGDVEATGQQVTTIQPKVAIGGANKSLQAGINSTGRGRCKSAGGLTSDVV